MGQDQVDQLNKGARVPTASSSLTKYISLARLGGGALVVVFLLAPLYLFVLRPDDDDLATGRMVETPIPPERAITLGLKVGDLAPDFIVPSTSGGEYRLSDLRGRAVMINFWAAWCVSCLSELPEIKSVQAQFGVDTVTVLAVNVGESRARALEYVNFLQAPFAWALDRDLTVTDAYGVVGLPLSLFIDSSGVIQAVYRGHASRELLEQFVEAAVRAEPAGPVPPILRIISTIPRERVLKVSSRGSEVVSIASKTLRCDVTYCAEPALLSLQKLDGIKAADLKTRDGEPVLTVRFDGRRVTEAQIIDTLAAALEANTDPLYDGPLEIRRES
jgi:cytochrome c biogenesis protein CcmG, thiol:disulfide interchange protein DsbE